MRLRNSQNFSGELRPPFVPRMSASHRPAARLLVTRLPATRPLLTRLPTLGLPTLGRLTLRRLTLGLLTLGLLTLGLLTLGLLTPPVAVAAGRGKAPATTIGPAVRISASSYDRDGGKPQGPELAFDGDLSTVWQEGNPGVGTGEWLEVSFKTPQALSTLTVFGGHFGSQESFSTHNHLADAELLLITTAGEETQTLHFADRFEPLTVPVGRTVKRLRLTFTRLYAGSIHAEGCVAEVAFDLSLKDPTLVRGLENWRNSPAGQSQLSAWRARLEEAREAARAGNLESLTPVYEAARRGLEPIRAYVAGHVQPGFMLAHLDPEPLSLDILRDIAVPEGIPALEQAQWLVDDVDVPHIRTLMTFLAASGDLKRPPRRTLPRFGTSGWEPGAFRSLDGPLPFTVDNSGYIYIADVANNRVQRLDSDGRLERASGSVPVITDTFLDVEVPHYVAGNRAGEAEGLFVQPVAISSNGKDKVAVLDSHLRLQLLDVDFNHLRHWSLPANASLGLGPGDLYPRLLWHDRRLYVLWGRKGFVYDESGKLSRELSFEQPVRSAVAFKRSLLVYHGGRTVHQYGLDGVYLNELVTLAETETLEDLELAIGPDKRLYVLTDQGRILKYTLKGVLEGVGSAPVPPGVPTRLMVTPDALLFSARDALKRQALSTLQAPGQ